MDRDHELADDYAKVTRLIERWEKRKQGRIEGNWYLFEKEGRFSITATLEFLHENQMSVEKMEHLGYIATKIIMFKE